MPKPSEMTECSPMILKKGDYLFDAETTADILQAEAVAHLLDHVLYGNPMRAWWDSHYGPLN